jgi:hypothetical protein
MDLHFYRSTAVSVIIQPKDQGETPMVANSAVWTISDLGGLPDDGGWKRCEIIAIVVRTQQLC